MSKCENCIHYEICDHYHIATDTGEYAYQNIDLEEREDVEEICDHFKDKSLFVELPCKVGDDVWYNTFKKNATVCIGIQPHKVDRIDVCLVCGEKELIETKIPIWQIGKIVFLTKEDAEAKLKEMQNESIM